MVLKKPGPQFRLVFFTDSGDMEVIVTFCGSDEAKLCPPVMSNDFGLKLHSEKFSGNRSHFEGGKRPRDNFDSFRSNGCEN
jgi:hypothetical protein